MDYCTLFPEGWWSHCCAAHDLAYANQVGRAGADFDLLMCVASSTSSPMLLGVSTLIAGVMFIGVRVFGRYFYNKAKQP
jgi:hypothetical protein